MDLIAVAGLCLLALLLSFLGRCLWFATRGRRSHWQLLREFEQREFEQRLRERLTRGR